MTNIGADQTARMHRLVCAFVVRKPRRQGFSRRCPIISIRISFFFFCFYPNSIAFCYPINLKTFFHKLNYFICGINENICFHKLNYFICSSGLEQAAEENIYYCTQEYRSSGFAINTDADQPALLHRLISAFVFRFLESTISNFAASVSSILD